MKRKKDILSQKIEKVPVSIFESRYKRIVRDEFKNKFGVYALYDKNEKLSYVGRASGIKRRLKQHLKNKHKKFSYFSVYFTKTQQQISEIESIVLSIVAPRENKQKPLRRDRQMENRIIQAMKKIDSERREFGKSGQKKRNIQKNKARPTPKKLFFEKNKPLEREYKGKYYNATLLKSGKIKYKNKLYDSPSSAGKAITHTEVNGWDFWKIQNDDGNWVKLKELKK